MESNLLLARVNDTIKSCELNNKPKFLGFLSKEESVLVENHLKNRNVCYSFFGGEHRAQRVYLGCFPEWLEDQTFPISALTFSFRPQDILRHRDFLGALMSLGIKRESVGDILIEEGRAVVFLSREIEDFVLKNLHKVGRIGVNARKGYDLPLPETDLLTEKTVTVASMRLDCVVSAVANLSRNTANDYIKNGLVAVNSVPCEKSTKILFDGDVLSIRHKGKFQILSSEIRTKKDRTVLKYNCF